MVHFGEVPLEGPKHPNISLDFCLVMLFLDLTCPLTFT